MVWPEVTFQLNQSMKMHQRTVIHSYPRSNRSFIYDENSDSCDCFSYCYLSLAVLLFFSGSGLTYLVLREDTSQYSPLNRFWMAGPLFICTGLMVALKVLLYIRRRRFISILIRDLTRDPNHWEQVSTFDHHCIEILYQNIVSTVWYWIFFQPAVERNGTIQSSRISSIYCVSSSSIRHDYSVSTFATIIQWSPQVRMWSYCWSCQ